MTPATIANPEQAERNPPTVVNNQNPLSSSGESTTIQPSAKQSNQTGKAQSTGKLTALSEVGSKPRSNCAERIMAACSLILVPFALWQLYLLNASTNAATKAAVAAKESVNVALDTSEKTLRAYVSVVEGRVEWIKGGAAIYLTIRNSGQTPSKETKITLTRFECASTKPLTGAFETKENMPYTLASGEKFILNKSLTISVEDLRGIKTGKMAIYAAGTISYVDIFNETQTESFDLVQGYPYRWDAESMGINLPAHKVDDLPKNGS